MSNHFCAFPCQSLWTFFTAHFTYSLVTNRRERQSGGAATRSVSEGLGRSQKIGELSEDNVLHFPSTPTPTPTRRFSRVNKSWMWNSRDLLMFLTSVHRLMDWVFWRTLNQQLEMLPVTHCKCYFLDLFATRSHITTALYWLFTHF